MRSKQLLNPLTLPSGRRYSRIGLLLLLACCSAAQAEATANPTISSTTVRKSADVIITGQVKDEQGLPLPGVTVKLQNSQLGTLTDVNGNYKLTVPEGEANKVLIFSFIGFTSQTVTIGQQTQINISLKPDTSKSLNEVVVVGYGTQRRATINSSIGVVAARDINEKPVLNAVQALQGESPNLVIQQSTLDPGATPIINIRGVSTTGNNDPLLVIDGIVSQSIGDLSLLNPNDIASVTVLKDAGAAAIYGSRGANGVLLVTTKSGKPNQKATVNYNGNYGWQKPNILVRKVNAADNAYYKNESLVNSGLPPSFTPAQIQELAAQGNGTWDVDHLLYNAPQLSQNLSVSGGGASNTYFISAGYLNQLSNFIGNGGSGSKFGYQKYNLRVNQSVTVGRFKLSGILEYTKSRNKTNSVGNNNVFADANRVPYNYSWQDENGNYLTNPIASQYNEHGVLEKGGFNQADNDRIFGNLTGILNITKELNVTGVFGGTIQNNGNLFRRTQVNYLPAGVYGNDLTTFDNNSKSHAFNTQVYLNYIKSFKQHNLNATLGVSSEITNQRGFQLQKTLTDPVFGNATTGTLIDATNSYNSIGVQANSLQSAFGRFSYDYKQRYFLDFVFRNDVSSKFAKGERSGFFPSVNAGYLISDESFMEPLKNTLNSLKLRATYGIVGNNQTAGNYTYLTTYFNYPGAYGYNGVIQGGAGTNLSNPLLTWEEAATLNFGFDFGLFNNKLTGSFDYFDKTTRKIQQNPLDVPSVFGATPPTANVAKVQNRGWEAQLTYTWKTPKVTQSFSANIGNTQNKLLELTGNTQQIIYNQDVYQLLRKVGQPLTQYYGYETDGYFQNQADVNTLPKPAGAIVGPGDLKFKDLNGDGKIDDNDKKVIGNPFPHYTFGFTYRLAVGGFDLTLFVQGVGQRDAFLRGELVEPYHYNYGATLYEHMTNYWTPSNPDARYPRLASIGSPSNTNNWRNGSDVYRYNAAYARLKNVNIGYTLPSALTRKAGMQRVRVSAIGQNLLTLSKLRFIDPETTEFGNSVSPNTGSNSARNYLLPIFIGAGLDITF
ncbi:SusC/RagA family TonB-linked outer membrane protein [Mucilaginibacter aquatilis]|uniref:SusC/RagA family TonB-linked outer membrane protein n=1 Tax=Mucilaginibacter aquatilis TaxID=1517760 RepID=A0A6I4ICW2_9SPHI|nr:TonB-dependent receptor [Mucilaginibacter aquatilis]MVN93031.1 SusC/RagA family TonB-linked outer membrane protein [Mucilaginibacter aquatilis]